MWTSSLSSCLSQITEGSQLRWGTLRKHALHLSFKGFHFPVWVWEAADHDFAPSSIHMLLCKQMLTNPCCLEWHRTQVDTGLMQSHSICGINLQLRTLQQYKLYHHPQCSSQPAPACPGGSTGTPSFGYRYFHYNPVVLEVWNQSGLWRKKNKAQVLQKEYQLCSFKFVDENNLISPEIYMSFYSKSFKQRTLNKISILIRRKYNHQCCGKQSRQYQCDNYFKK